MKMNFNIKSGAKTLIVEDDDNFSIGDGHHTMDELYEHRHLLFLNLCLMNIEDGPNVRWKIDPCVKDWVIVYLELSTGQISYHLPIKYLNIIRRFFHHGDTEWDGHNSKITVERLLENLGGL